MYNLNNQERQLHVLAYGVTGALLVMRQWEYLRNVVEQWPDKMFPAVRDLWDRTSGYSGHAAFEGDDPYAVFELVVQLYDRLERVRLPLGSEPLPFTNNPAAWRRFSAVVWHLDKRAAPTVIPVSDTEDAPVAIAGVMARRIQRFRRRNEQSENADTWTAAVERYEEQLAKVQDELDKARAEVARLKQQASALLIDAEGGAL